MKGDQAERLDSGSFEFGWPDLYNSHSQFEFPDQTTYEPLYLETSDESAAAEAKRFQEIREFLDDRLDQETVNRERKPVAESYHRRAMELILAARNKTKERKDGVS